MILAAILSSVLVASAPPVECACVTETGEVIRTQLPLAEEHVKGVTHGWVWASDAAPQRVARDAMGELDALRETLRAGTRNVEVNVESRIRTRRERDEPVSIVAAPVAMWDELPEEFLPVREAGTGAGRLPVPSHGRVRVRAFRAAESSAWVTTDARSTLALPMRTAKDLRIAVDAASGGTQDFAAQLLTTGTALRPPEPVVRFNSTRGEMTIRSAPETDPIVVVIRSRDHAPFVFSGALYDLPRHVTLARGGSLEGIFVDEEGTALPRVTARLEAWANPEILHVLTWGISADDQGRWKLSGIPAGEAMLVIDDVRFARTRHAFAPGDGARPVRQIVLRPPSRLQVHVSDGRDPVPGATVRAGNASAVRTDDAGIALVDGIGSDRGLRLRVEATGFLPSDRNLDGVVPPEIAVILERGVHVRGRVVGEDRVPIATDLRIITGTRESEIGRIDGELELDLEPAREHELMLVASDHQALRVAVPAGVAGDTRDLGEIILRRGASVVGRVESAHDLQPIAGASVWTVPVGASMAARVAGVRLESASRADGSFELSGCDAVPVLLRADAPGYARTHRAVDLSQGGGDAGTIRLERGATVTVAVTDGASHVQLDLRGEGDALDLVRAVPRDKVATLRNIPAGTFSLQVWKSSALLCTQDVEVAPGEQEVTVTCDAAAPLVRGTVLVAGRKASGMLHWRPRVRGSESLIGVHASPGGLVRQEVVGRTPDAVVIDVIEGSFQTRDLGAGSWQVTWLPDGGGSSGARDVTITREKEQSFPFAFGGRAIRGRVVDSNQRPVRFATVLASPGSASAISDAEGRFDIAGVERGTHLVHARHRNLRSESVEVVVGSTDATDVLLVLDDPATKTVEVAFTAGDGQPATGALVVLEIRNGSRRTTATDATGRARFVVATDGVDSYRIAGIANGAIALGTWTSQADVTLRAGATGQLAISTEVGTGTIRILSADGWDLSAVLATLGNPPTVAPDRPFTMHGVPVGPWTIQSGNCQQIVDVRASGIARAECP